jgi:hypothetical protein
LGAKLQKQRGVRFACIATANQAPFDIETWI